MGNKEIVKEIYNHMTSCDDEMSSVAIMKKYNLTPVEYVRISSKFHKVIEDAIERENWDADNH